MKTIIEMAREAGLEEMWELTPRFVERLERFADLVAAAERAKRERNFCPRCGKRTADLTTIHTCTPPQIDPNNRGFPWTQKHNPAPQLFAAMPSNILPPLRTKEAGIDPNKWAFDNGLEST